MTSDLPIVEMINGVAVLTNDPVAEGVIAAVQSHNRALNRRACGESLRLNADRIEHFKRRITELKRTPEEVVIVVLNVDDEHGGPMADVLMPNHEAQWQAYRDEGKIPFARGLAGREFIQAALEHFDPQAAIELKQHGNIPVVVVVDYGVAAVFVA